MQARIFEFDVAIETDAQPDAGTPASDNDLLTKGYADAHYATLRTPIQEHTGGTITGACDGSNLTFVLSHTPYTAFSLKLYRNGALLIQGVDYTLATATITMTVAPTSNQVLNATYEY